jgi:undecaprenyl-diphosphatase
VYIPSNPVSSARQSQPVRGRSLLAGAIIIVAALLLTLTFAPTHPAGATAAESAADVVESPSPGVGDSEAADSQMTTWKAIILGAVEGITEYLPISSTGHLIVTQRILGIGDTSATKDAADTYAISIQLGAILAVLILYRRRILTVFQGLLGRNVEGRSLLVALTIAFLPAVVVGVLFEEPIKENLLGTGPVIAAWIVGGVLLLVLAPRIRPERPGLSVTSIGPRQAAIIGAVQVLAMWPGTSRSLVTILAALAVGTTLAAAVEFSFLLGLMTLGAATIYEGAKNGSTVIDAYGWVDPLVGLIVAFVAAVVAVRWMVSWLQTRSLAVFGWERLVVAAITIGLIATSVI